MERVDCDDGMGHVRTDYEEDLNRIGDIYFYFFLIMVLKR